MLFQTNLCPYPTQWFAMHHLVALRWGKVERKAWFFSPFRKCLCSGEGYDQSCFWRITLLCMWRAGAHWRGARWVQAQWEVRMEINPRSGFERYLEFRTDTYSSINVCVRGGRLRSWDAAIEAGRFAWGRRGRRGCCKEFTSGCVYSQSLNSISNSVE